MPFLIVLEYNFPLEGRNSKRKKMPAISEIMQEERYRENVVLLLFP